MLLVEGAGVQIATKDWGGSDIPMLLTHGAGSDKRSLNLLVEQLLPTFRVVTFDMRNHGQSTEGSWQWPLVTADVEAVRAHYAIDAPVVAGHSLGGMVAAMYAVDYPGRCRSAINIDGQGRGWPRDYVGKTEAEVHALWQKMDEFQSPQLATASPRMLEMFDEINKLDLFDTWRAVPCPLLIFNCVGHDPLADGEGMEWFVEMMGSYRPGLQREFDALASEIPSIAIAEVDKNHVGVILEPQECAEKMATFVTNYS